MALPFNAGRPLLRARRRFLWPRVARECYKWLLCQTQDNPTSAKPTVEVHRRGCRVYTGGAAAGGALSARIAGGFSAAGCGSLCPIRGLSDTNHGAATGRRVACSIGLSVLRSQVRHRYGMGALRLNHPYQDLVRNIEVYPASPPTP